MKTQARYIRVNDILASGEIVKDHKLLVHQGRIYGVAVTLLNPRNNRTRTGRWNTRTLISCRELA